MLIKHFRARKTLAIAISTITTLTGAGLAQAQEELEEITITGSRIARDVGFESPVPVTALNADELSMFAPGLGVSEQLENLPQYFGNISSDNIGGRVTADVGQSQLNMRGMGGERTLVLLDGSRVVPSDRRSSVSVDYLPSSLIQRVDVVTGGASAAYGADALAGVTNFILNRDFTGLDLRFTSGINEEGDGEFNRGSITWGDDFMDGRLHVFGTVEERVNDGYRRKNADWDKHEGYVKNPDWTPGAPAGTPLRLTKRYVYDTEFSPLGLIRQNGFSLNYYQFNESGTGVMPFGEGDFTSLPGQPGTQQTQVGSPGDPQYELFRRSFPQSFERVGVEQQTAFLGADFQVSDSTKLWGNFLYGRTRNTPEPTSSGGGGTGLGHGSLAFMTIYRDNFFLPEAVRQTMAAEGRSSFRMDQQGYMTSDWGFREHPVIVNRMGSLTLGFDTELAGDWTLRGSYQYGEAQKHNANYGWERLDRFYMAVDAVDDPDNPGTPICRTTLVQRQLAAQGRSLEAELHQWAQDNTLVFRTDALAKDFSTPEPIDYPFAVDSVDGTISDCVPVNMFGAGNQSDAAMDYIFSSRAKTGISTQEQDFAEILAQGTLWEGWGAGPVSAAIGATYRKESIKQIIVDTAIDALGPMYNVTLPDGTIALRGISFIMNGSATNLHRFSSQPVFSGGFDVTEMFGETIIPLFNTDNGGYAELNLAARYADYSRAGKKTVWKGGLSWSINDQFRVRGTLSHDMREGSFEELFVQQGRGANISDPWNDNQSITAFNLTGGNPDLKPEEADTRVIGFVYQPAFVDGLQLSLDRYVVELESAIGTFSEQNIVDQCFNTGALCDRVQRDPATGFVTRVTTVFINIDQAKVSGWDFEASYRMEPDFISNEVENLNFRIIAGYMDENSETPVNGSKIDSAGSSNLPKKTVTANLSYGVGDWAFNLQHNWQGSSLRNVTWVEGVDVDDNSVPSVNLTNLGIMLNGETASGSTWRASLNVNNLFDRDPIFAGTTSVGDVLGRRYALGFNYSF